MLKSPKLKAQKRSRSTPEDKDGDPLSDKRTQVEYLGLIKDR